MEHNMVLLILLLSVISTCYSDVIRKGEVENWKEKSTPWVVKHFGYPIETHHVVTDDGYILCLHRIPHGKKNETKKPKGTKEVFFLQHGLAESSAVYVTHAEALAFVLADEGYDVWMGNTRGNTYSANHTFHEVESKIFWFFSFDEMAKYDLPAMINYAIETSDPVDGQVHYVGHSQGTMIIFAGLSDNVDLQDKFKAFYALAPVARLDYLFKPLKIIARVVYGMKWLIDKQNFFRFPFCYKELKAFMKVACEINPTWCVMPYMLKDNSACGANPEQCVIEYILRDEYRLTEAEINTVNRTVERIFSLGAAAINNLYHYAQVMAARVFQKYDYGTFGNILHYGSFKPPVYDLTKIQIPVTLISGTDDILSAPNDIEWIKEQLPNVLHNIIIEDYNHLDFLLAESANKKVFDRILKVARTEINGNRLIV